MIPALHTALLLTALAAALVAGCGGGKPADSGTTATGSTAAPATPAPATPAPTTPAEPAPPASTAAVSVELGAKVFVQRCALCHGPEGRGDGPGSVALKPKPRNFHDQAYMSSRTDAQLLEVIHKGKGAMPRWGGVISEAEMQSVLGYVRELGKKP